MRLNWFNRTQPTYNSALGHTIKELVPLDKRTAANTMFISLPAQDIPELARRYFAAMESEQSDDWCRCVWMIHPDDVNIDKGNCRECNQPMKSKVHDLIPTFNVDTHKFRGVRKRKVDEAWDCPVHTREGMIIYFFEWVFKK